MTDNAYLAAARSGQNGFWRYLATVVLILALVFGPTSCLVLGLMLAVRSPDLQTVLSGPAFLAANLLPFVFIPIGLWIGLRLLHRRPFLTLVNPTLRVDWKRFFLAGAAWFLLAALGDLVLAQVQPENYAWTFQWEAFLPFLIISLLLIPMQAGAEELLFRGYLTQGFGLLSAWAGWLIPSVLFGLLHGVNPEVGAYGMLLTMPTYIGMGLLLGWVTLRSQSLEMALGMHIANNLYASLLVTFPSSALQTESMFAIQKYDPAAALVAFVLTALVFVIGFELLLRRHGLTRAGVLLLLIGALLLGACSGPAAAQETVSPTMALTGTAAGTPAAGTPAAGTPPAVTPTGQTGTPAATAQTGTPAGPPVPFALEDCLLEGTQIEARCGTLVVPENRAMPEGQKIALNIVVLKAISRSPEPDPLFLLAGGPGQAATEAFTGLIGALDRIRQKRDLVMIDQRGTGKSGPLSCEPPEPQATPTPGVIRADPPIEESLAEIDRCMEMIGGADLTQYTTDVAMQDLDDARQALGYDTINLLGVSYGTRAALAYAGLYPDRVRSLVLDGVAPLGWGLGVTMRFDAQRALDLILARCEGDTACRETFPDLKRELAELLAGDYYEGPREVTVPDPLTGERRRVRISPLLVSATVRMMSYNDVQAALIPLMIHQAAQGDPTILVSQYLQVVGSLAGGINYGMYYSVWCYEDLPLLPPGGELGEFYFDPKLEIPRQICQRWPTINRSVEIPEPANPNIPILLISGEADPVTPPVNAELAAHGFTHTLSVVLPGMGHGNFYVGCMPAVVRDFIDRASVEGLDTACTQNITPQSFFLSPVGPAR